MSAETALRYDLQVIADWIEPGSRVLDLGCGNGDLLLHLKREKQVIGTGIESDENKVALASPRGSRSCRAISTKRSRTTRTDPSTMWCSARPCSRSTARTV